MHCNLVKTDYQHVSRVLFSFVPNKQFGQLINISPHFLTIMNTVNTEFSFVEVWFTDQASNALEIEDNVTQQNQDLENMLRVMIFCHLLKKMVINMVKN